MPTNISGDCIFRAARQRFRTDVPRAHRAGTFARRALSAFRGTVFSPVFKGGKTGLRYFKICQTYFCMPFQAYQLSSLLDYLRYYLFTKSSCPT